MSIYQNKAASLQIARDAALKGSIMIFLKNPNSYIDSEIFISLLQFFQLERHYLKLFLS